MQKKIWSLVGCGWLGTPLLQNLIKTYPDVHFVVSTRTNDQCQKLLQHHQNIKWVHLDLTDLTSSSYKDALKELKQSSLMIFLLPPQPIEHLQNFVSSFSPELNFVFTSSTSVYGKNLGLVQEKDVILDPENTNSPLLISTEEFIRSYFKRPTLLRLGGLYGNKRHPVFFLQGRKDCRGGNEFIHLCSQQDGVTAILKVIEKQVWGETIHIVSDLRIKKSLYYQKMAEKLKLESPEYLEEVSTQDQTNLDNSKAKNLLEMNFENPLEYKMS
jgi:nucleoside-diphosphate-sugar epimerase